MNTPLRRVALAMMAMVVLLLANITYIQAIKADEYRKDPRNRRTMLAEYSRERGKIIAGGLALADVQPTEGQMKFRRVYLDGPLYAPVTGYYSQLYGAGGMERAERDVLNGDADSLLVRRLSDLITGRDTRGGNVELTIDPRIQEAAYQAMAQKGFRGAVVALDPKTGAIKAMVSTPSYDPNPLASHDAAEQKEAWERYTKDPANPMRNRAISETYPPGSTFKLVVTAAALENGYTKDSQLTAEANIILPGTRTGLENFNGKHCGSGATTSLEQALALSCNTAFAQLAGELGETKLRAQAEKFGIGEQDLEIPLSVTASTLGDIPDRAALYQTGIGQRDVKLTPLQDAMIAAAIANRGVRMQPYLVQRITGPDLTVYDETDPEKAERVMSAENARVLTEMMIKSEENTKGEGKIRGVTIASKTGTAEHGVNPKETNPHAWYVAFAPAEDPKIAVAVIVESGGDRGLGATGGLVAAPVGRTVIRAALQGGG